MKKRGQITLYIIIGLILLLFIMLGLYLFKSVIEPEAVTKPIEKVPIELEPVQKFVQDCISMTTEQALKTVMEHGGYADLSKLQADIFKPTEANSVEYTPGTNYLVPYWSYLKSKNDCTGGCEFASMIKPLCREGSSCTTNGRDSVEEEIDWYIIQNLKSCLNDFIIFKPQDIKIELVGDILPMTTIRKDSVNVIVQMPIKIDYLDSTKRMNTFNAVVPTQITELYTVALDLLNYETTECMVEDHQINAIGYYQGFESDDLPPYAADTYGDHAKKFWIKQTVEKKLKAVTSFAMQNIRILNTDVFPYPNIDSSSQYPDTIQAMYDQFTFRPLDEFHDVKVNFFYFPWWNPYFEIDPSSGSLIGPSDVISGSGGGWLSYILNKIVPTSYEYYYHYSFPVVVELRAEDPRDETKEELFRFALESNIRANKCFSPDALVTTETSGAGLLCDEDFRGTIEYTINVKDEVTGQAVKDVEIYYYAGETCYLGKTDSTGKLKSTFPVATGGFVDIKKEGYLEYFVHEKDFSMLSDIRLKPLFKKNINVKIFNETNLLSMSGMNQPAGLVFRDSVLYNADSTHQLVLTMSRVKETYHEGTLESTASISYENGEIKIIPEEIELAPGKYEFDIMLIYTQPVTVPEENDRICVNCNKNPNSQCKTSPNWLSSCDSCDWKEDSACTTTCWEETDCYKWGFYCSGSCDADEEITYEAIDLEQSPNGGVKFDSSNNYWMIGDYSELTDNTKPDVIFYVVQQKLPVRYYLLENLDIYKTYSQNYKYLFVPEFSNG